MTPPLEDHHVEQIGDLYVSLVDVNGPEQEGGWLWSLSRWDEEQQLFREIERGYEDTEPHALDFARYVARALV